MNGMVRILVLISSIFFIVFFLFLGISFCYREISFDSHEILSYASLFLFIGVCFVSIKKDQYYIFFLPFILIAFPSPINDFFPGVLSGPPTEKGSTILPFLTHIDIFIIIGVVRKYLISGAKMPYRSNFLFLLLTAMFLSLIVNLIRCNDNKDFLFLLAGSFQIRYIIGFYILVTEYNFTKHSSDIYKGIIFSIFFLFIESSINTLLKGGNRLTSGSLGMNTFGNLIAALFVFLLFYKNYKEPLIKYSHYTAMLLCLIIIFLTKNRMSIFAIIISFIFIKIFVFGSLRLFVKYLFLGTASLLLFSFFLLKYIPERYNPVVILNKVELNSFSLNPDELLSIEGSWETNSIITRLQLYSASYKMITTHPIVGIGSGKWNNEKFNYGFKQNVLLDSHNGYLSILSQYGFLGLFLIYFIYFLPFFRLRKFDDSYPPLISLLGLINIVFIIADISNSGVYKYQVFAFLSFISMTSLFQECTNSDVTKENDLKNIEH